MGAEEIGSIGKATAGDILTSRKIYLVTMVQPSPGAPDGFEQRYNAYWSAVEEQISKIETTAGTVNRIFAEGIIGRGDDAMLMVQQSNPGAHSLVRQRVRYRPFWAGHRLGSLPASWTHQSDRSG